MKKRILPLLLCMLLLTGCAAGNTPGDPTQTTAAPTQTATSAPTETDAVSSLHSGMDSSGVFLEGTLFVGDALLGSFLEEYLLAEDLMGQALYMTASRISPSSFLRTENREGGRSVCSRELQGNSWQEVIGQQGSSLQAIYLLLGTAYDSGAGADSYLSLVDYLQMHCPEATIYLMTYPQSTQTAEESNRVIREACGHYGPGDRVLCIDLGDLMVPDTPTKDSLEDWYDAILDFLEENQIPE